MELAARSPDAVVEQIRVRNVLDLTGRDLRRDRHSCQRPLKQISQFFRTGLKIEEASSRLFRPRDQPPPERTVVTRFDGMELCPSRIALLE